MLATKFELGTKNENNQNVTNRAIGNFEMVYKIEFTCGIRRHQVYKTNWTLLLNGKLDCKKDNREEALSYDKHSVGVFKKGWNPCWLYNY